MNLNEYKPMPNSNKSIYTTKNRLRVAVDEMHDVETISVGVFVNTGSRSETKAQNGISHFLEHMAFKGTKKRSARQIAEEFEGIGGYINAYTSRERTVYYVKVLAEYGEFAVEFLADILQNSVFDEAEIEKERGVILQEIAMTNDTPDDIIFDYFQSAAFPNQPIGRSILGSGANVKKFSRSDFQNYIDKRYNYQDIAVVGAGKLTQKDLARWVEKHFNSLGTSKNKSCEAANYVGCEFRKEKKLEQVNLVLGFPGISYHHDDYFTSATLALILGGGMSSRLFWEVREKLGLAYSISAFNQCFRDSGVFLISAATSPDKCNKLLTTTGDEIKKISENITKEELQRAKTQFLASIKMGKESSNSRLQKLGSDILIFDRVSPDEEIINKIEAVQKSSLLDFAGKIFTAKPTLAMIGKLKEVDGIEKLGVN